MSKSQALRALVTERLKAAAEDIFVLFERTIAEYEEELCRSKEENQRNQQRLDAGLSPRCVQPTAGPRLQRGPGLTRETTGVKDELEEPGIKQEEEQLPISIPECSGAGVEREESSLLQQRQSEHRQERHREDVRSEPHFHLETSSYTDNDPTLLFLAAQMETEAYEDHYLQVQTRDRHTAAQNSALSPQMKTVNHGDTDQTKQECSFCLKQFTCLANLQMHIRNHTGDKPYTCSICEKTFTQKNILINHRRMHTGEKPFSCSFCRKTFAHSSTLHTHMRVHTGEKPYSCTLCEKRFTQRSTLDKHLRIHRGEKPYCCEVCQRPFSQKSDLNAHMRTHTGEKPFQCSVCSREFAVKSNLYRHMGTHTGVRRGRGFRHSHMLVSNFAQDGMLS